jgi:predicted transcriptional regulator
MTNKQKIQNVVDRMPEDVAFEQALYQMYVLREVEAGMADVRAGRLIDHDELFDELLRDETTITAPMDAKGKKRSATAKGSDRRRQPENGRGIHQATKRGRR